MVLIATLDLELAKALGETITAPKTYVVRSEGDEKEGPVWLRHQVHQAQPSVVLLDVRFGGQLYRAVEAVPRMLATRSSPIVILLTPWKQKKVDKEAARMGCFEVLDITRRSFLADAVSAVASAELERKARGPSSGEVPPGRDEYH